MNGVLTRWSVLQTHELSRSDVSPTGAIKGEAVERLCMAAVSAYLDQCPTLRRARAGRRTELRYTITALPDGAMLSGAASVTVAASATEVEPRSFSISIRMRPSGGETQGVANGRCMVQLRDAATGAMLPIDDQVRDELALLERAAVHLN